MGLFAWRKDYQEKASARYAATKKHGFKPAHNRKEPHFEEAPYKVMEETKQPAPAPAESAAKKPRRTRKPKATPDQVVLTPDTTQSEV